MKPLICLAFYLYLLQSSLEGDKDFWCLHHYLKSDCASLSLSPLAAYTHVIRNRYAKVITQIIPYTVQFYFVLTFISPFSDIWYLALKKNVTVLSLNLSWIKFLKIEA